MDISFALLLMLVLAIFAQASFLARLQFLGYYLEPEILTVVRPLSSAPVPPSAFLNQGKDGSACAVVPVFSTFSSANRHLKWPVLGIFSFSPI
jgi:hypothetical protein